MATPNKFPVCVKCGALINTANEGYMMVGKWYCDTCGPEKEGDASSNETNKVEQNSKPEK